MSLLAILTASFMLNQPNVEVPCKSPPLGASFICTHCYQDACNYLQNAYNTCWAYFPDPNEDIEDREFCLWSARHFYGGRIAECNEICSITAINIMMFNVSEMNKELVMEYGNIPYY